jgi:hypothetical protein
LAAVQTLSPAPQSASGADTVPRPERVTACAGGSAVTGILSAATALGR